MIWGVQLHHFNLKTQEKPKESGRRFAFECTSYWYFNHSSCNTCYVLLCFFSTSIWTRSMTLAIFEGSGFESSRLCSLEELAVFCFSVYLYLPGTVFREQFGQNRFGLVLVEGLFPETMGNSCLYNRFISWMAPLGLEDCSGRYGLEIRTFPMTGECSWDQLQVRDDDVCSIFSHGSILCRIWAGKYIIISDLGVGNGPISVPFNWSCACVTQ